MNEELTKQIYDQIMNDLEHIENDACLAVYADQILDSWTPEYQERLLLATEEE